jgi:hypothetical protein
VSYSFTAASSQFLSISEAVVTATPLTIGAWIKPSSTATVNGNVCAITNNAAGNTRQTLVQNTTNATANTHDGAAAGSSSQGGLDTTNWHYATAVFTNSTSRTGYRNGTAAAANATSATPAGLNRTAVGARINTSTTAFFDGLIAEVAIWDVALSGADITALAGGDSPMSLATPPVRYWRLKTDGDLVDVVGESATLTANAGAAFNADNPTVDDPPAAPAATGASTKRLLLGIG